MNGYQYHGTSDLIAIPGRSVQTFPSGLVRVERSFLCRKNDVARHRNSLRVNEPMPLDDGSPAFDGLFIFPEPQEQVRDDGFIDFRVTAYGRTDVFSQISIERSTIKSTYQEFRVRDEGGGFFEIPSINEIYIIRGVLPSADSAAALLTPPSIENPIIINARTSQPVVQGVIETDTQTFQTSISIILDNFSSTNFGLWAEYVVTWKASATVINSLNV